MSGQMGTEDLISKYQAITPEGEEEEIQSLLWAVQYERKRSFKLLQAVQLEKSFSREGYLEMVLKQHGKKLGIDFDFKVEGLGNNIFMFKIHVEADKRRMLAGGPWHFD